MLRILLLIAAIVFPAASQQAQPRADLLQLMELQGGRQALEQIVNRETIEAQMRQLLKPEAQPAAERAKMEEFITEFGKEFADESRKRMGEVMDMFLAVMAKYYTPEDVKALLAFYQTPAGKKLAEQGPKLSLELMQVGQKWGQELGAQIGQRVGERIEQKAKGR